MSTEWIQILVTLAIIVPLTILTGRYLMWRKWDKERRINRLARRQGYYMSYAPVLWGTMPTTSTMWGTAPVEFRCQDPEQAWIDTLSDSGHSVKA